MAAITPGVRLDMGYVLPLWTVPELIVLTEAVYLSVKKVDWKKVAQNLKEKAFRRDSATFYTAQVSLTCLITIFTANRIGMIGVPAPFYPAAEGVERAYCHHHP
eukprot:1376277-Amorphochlora_amoeboformis.AAC.2